MSRLVYRLPGRECHQPGRTYNGRLPNDPRRKPERKRQILPSRLSQLNPIRLHAQLNGVPGFTGASPLRRKQASGAQTLKAARGPSEEDSLKVPEHLD